MINTNESVVIKRFHEPFGEFTVMIKLLNCFTQLLMNHSALFD